MAEDSQVNMDPIAPPASDNSDFPFFSLPRETRDYVYNYLLQGSRFQFTQRLSPTENCVRFTLYYEFAKDFMAQRSRFPLWMLACKQMQVEGLDQLYRQAYCSSYGWCWCDGCEPPNDQCEHNPGKLLKLERVRNICFEAKTLDYRRIKSFALWFVERGPKPMISVVSDISECLESPPRDHLLEYLKSRPKRAVKQLKLRLCLPPALLAYRYESLRKYALSVDLSEYQKLGARFDRVTIVLVYPTITMFNNDLLLYAILYPKFQQAAAELGKFLVGGNDVGQGAISDAGGGGWKLWDCFRSEEGEEIEDGGEPINGRYEWYLEVARQPTKKSGTIEHMGLRYFGTHLDHFGLADEEEFGKVSWKCKQTGTIMNLDLPLDLTSGDEN